MSTSQEHITNDPQTPPEDASTERVEEYRAELSTYVSSWIARNKKLTPASAEVVWSDFVNDFCDIAFEHLDKDSLYGIRHILQTSGVTVESRRGLPLKRALLTCWRSANAPICISSNVSPQSDALTAGEKNDDGTSAPTIKPPPRTTLVVSRREESRDDDHSSIAKTARDDPKALDSVVKALNGRQRYSGKFDEDLLEILEVYELNCKLYNVGESVMRGGIIHCLAGPALGYYGKHLQNCQSYKEAVDGLLQWFTSDEQKARLLQEWQTTTLSAWMQRHPSKSQADVFRDLSAYLSKIQRQLHTDYLPDRFLKDQLVMCADLPEVSRALKEHPPKSSQEANQRIAALLSSEPNSARTTHGEVYFGLNQRLHGKAERTMRKPRMPKPEYRPGSDRRKLSKVKGCWVCGEEHLAHRFHSKEEVDKAVKRLKADKAFVSIEDASTIFTAEAEHEQAASSDESDWESDESNEAHVLIADSCKDLNSEIQKSLANHSFQESCGFYTHMENEINHMKSALQDSDSPDAFKGVMIDTGANYVTMIGLEQYKAYCKSFGIPAAIDKSEKRTVRGIGGKVKCFGMATIPIVFPNIGFVVDIKFYVTEGTGPTILCLKDLKATSMQLDIQNNTLHLMGKSEKLDLRNGLLWYQWQPDIGLFSEQELFRIHRSFGHPSVTSLYNVIRRARPSDATSETRHPKPAKLYRKFQRSVQHTSDMQPNRNVSNSPSGPKMDVLTMLSPSISCISTTNPFYMLSTRLHIFLPHVGSGKSHLQTSGRDFSGVGLMSVWDPLTT